MTPSSGPTATSRLRVVVLTLTISSFSVAALLGIVALLGGSRFGDTEGDVLLTTVILGLASVAALCYLAVGDDSAALRMLALLGGVTCVAAAVAGLWLTWGTWYDADADFGYGRSVSADLQDALAHILGIGSVLAATIAQICLLLAAAGRRRNPVRTLLVLTVVVASSLGLIISGLILVEDAGGEAMVRVIGVLAILDVLGTVVVVALAKFSGVGRDHPALHVRPDLAARVDALAASSGRDRDEILRTAVEQYLASSTTPPR